MGLFDKKKKSNMLDLPRYKGRPMLLFFESFVLDAIGEFPKERAELINNMNLAAVFNTQPKDWRLIIKDALRLSDTIEIAILDLWYRNLELAKKNDTVYTSIQFSMDFVDSYYAENSEVDVWKDNSLELAKERIRKVQEQG